MRNNTYKILFIFVILLILIIFPFSNSDKNDFKVPMPVDDLSVGYYQSTTCSISLWEVMTLNYSSQQDLHFNNNTYPGTECFGKVTGLDKVKEKINDLNIVLAERYQNDARDRLSDDGKDYGSVTINEDGYKIKVTLSKKVTWDQEGLAIAFTEMQPDDARHFAKLTYSVEEKKYNAAQPSIKAKLQEHRVVELKGTTIDISV